MVVRFAFAALLASLACLRGARLEAATVMIVHPVAPSAELTETVSRLHGELLSVGLGVTIIERPAIDRAGSAEGRAWLERVARDQRIDATIDVIGGARLEGADIWVFERAPQAAAGVTRVLAERDVEDAPARLAIRAIDVLRSLLIEYRLEGQPHAPPALAPSASGAPDRIGDRIGIALGAAVVTSLDGVGPAILPVVRVDGSLGRWLGLKGELAGLGTQPTIGATGARAHVAQQYGLVGACVCAASPRRLQPVLGISAGALRTTADGQADAPLAGHAVAQWSFLLEASLGARIRLAGRLHLTATVSLQVAEPYVEIRVVNARSATTGRPNLLLTVTLGEWL